MKPPTYSRFSHERLRCCSTIGRIYWYLTWRTNVSPNLSKKICGTNRGGRYRADVSRCRKRGAFYSHPYRLYSRSIGPLARGKKPHCWFPSPGCIMTSKAARKTLSSETWSSDLALVCITKEGSRSHAASIKPSPRQDTPGSYWLAAWYSPPCTFKTWKIKPAIKHAVDDLLLWCLVTP